MFVPAELVRILAEPLFEDDPPVGTVATVVHRDPNGGGVEVEFPTGRAVLYEDELEPAW